MFHANIQPNTPSGSGKKTDFVIFGIFVSAASLDIRPGPIYDSETLESDHAPFQI